MNLPWSQPVPAEAAPKEFEAMAGELSPRGVPYRYFGLEFVPGVWITVTPNQAQQLQRAEALTVREKEAASG